MRRRKQAFDETMIHLAVNGSDANTWSTQARVNIKTYVGLAAL
jgi:hypothetical protein